MKFSTRMGELVRWGVSLHKSDYDPKISPDMGFTIPIYNFEEGGFEYFPLANDEPRYRKLNSTQHPEELRNLEHTLNKMLETLGCTNKHRRHHFENLIAVQHRIITPDETERWDFILPIRREIIKYLDPS